MAFRKPSPDPPADAGSGEVPPDESPTDESVDESEALALAEEAEARAAEAEAVAAAARERARAAQLRRQAAGGQTADGGETAEAADATAISADDVAAPDPTESTPPDGPTPPDGSAQPGRRRLPRVRWQVAATAAAVVVICALLAASGYMTWQHRQLEAEKQRTAEFAAAARQGVVTLMSLDYNQAQEDVQRIIDSSTGQFREDFEGAAEEFAAVAEQSQVVTDVTVNSTAVESMTEDTAVVLISATSSITNAAGANQDPRSWRLSVDVARDGDQVKMAKVEFVP